MKRTSTIAILIAALACIVAPAASAYTGQMGTGKSPLPAMLVSQALETHPAGFHPIPGGTCADADWHQTLAYAGGLELSWCSVQTSVPGANCTVEMQMAAKAPHDAVGFILCGRPAPHRWNMTATFTASDSRGFTWAITTDGQLP